MERIKLFCLCAFVCTVIVASAAPSDPSSDDLFPHFLSALKASPLDTSSAHAFFLSLMENLKTAIPSLVANIAKLGLSVAPEQLEKAVSSNSDLTTLIDELRKIPEPMGDPLASDPSMPGREWAWVPLFQVAPKPGESASWESPCFKTNTLTLSTLAADGSLTLKLEQKGRKTLFCPLSEFYILSVVSQFHFQFSHSGVTTKTWKFSMGSDAQSAADRLDLEHMGVRVYRFLHGPIGTIIDMFDTFMLFTPMIGTSHVSPAAAKRNLNFLKNYAQMEFEPRPKATQLVNIDPNYIQDGDVFIILRLDGVDPMLAWAMGGSRGGHSTIALRIGGVLHVCESTTKDSYWPVEGVQCTEWSKYFKQCQDADFNIIHLPLAAQFASKFNAAKAYEWIQPRLGLVYGMSNILWTWMDTPTDNYPFPLTWQLHQILPGLLEKVSLDMARTMWLNPLTQRLHNGNYTEPASSAQVYAEMYKQGISFPDLARVPENDHWLYPTTQSGKKVIGGEYVCSVLVCNILRAGGALPDNGYNCAEVGVWDLYTTSLFDLHKQRPKACVDADPTLPYCQLNGMVRLVIPDAATRPIPGPHYYENCPRGNPPLWEKPVGC